MKTPKWAKCDICGKELQYLEAVSVCVCRAFLDFKGEHSEWTAEEMVEGPEYRCPYCKGTLFHDEMDATEFIKIEKRKRE